MISFVVVSYNSEKYIRDCLNHILAVNDMPHEVIVVDNNSSDATRQIIKSEFPSIRLIESEVNRGFSYGVNRGVKSAKGDLIFLMNPDAVILTPGVRAIRDYFSEDHVSVLGPKVVNSGDYSRQFSARRFPTLKTGIFNKSSIFTSLVPNNKFSREYLNPIIDDSLPQPVDWVSGCAMIIKKDIFHLIGGFDERFFVFYEDIDFCRRVRDAGYEIMYDPEVVVAHEIGISRTVPTIRINFERHRGMWIYYTKHFRRNTLLDITVFSGITLRFAITSLKVLLR